jgi:hypothetical protein
MTDEPRNDHETPPGYAPGGEAWPEQHPEPWVAHPETGEEPVQPDATAFEPEPVRRPRIWPRIAGVLILFLVVGGVWVYLNPGFVESSLRSWFPGAAGQDNEAAQIRTLDDRVARLEQELPADLAPLNQRLGAVEAHLPQSGQATSLSSADLRPVLARLDALEARVAATAPRSAGASGGQGVTGAPTTSQQGQDLRSLSERLDALERQQAEQTANAAKVAALTAQVNALAAHNAADVGGKLDDVEHRLGELAANQTKIAGTSDRVTRLAQVNAAEIALAAGRPLGPIPNAPPALAKFATAAPPTEAELRLSFAAAAQEALKVSLPDTEGKPFLDRVLARLQDFRLITVREGDKVVIGNSTAATLAHARVLLDVGDLGGAVRAVATLSGPPAEKMAPWLAQATSLQAAREALASLAEKD